MLVGEAAGRAGLLAPVSFVLAGACLAPTAASYAELAGRLPLSAGESAYVRTGFDSKTMGQVAGWMVIIAGTFASAAVADGSVGYLREFVDVSPSVLVVLVIWALANLALILMKRRGDAPPPETFTVRMWVPVIGLVTAVGLLVVTSWPWPTRSGPTPPPLLSTVPVSRGGPHARPHHHLPRL